MKTLLAVVCLAATSFASAKDCKEMKIAEATIENVAPSQVCYETFNETSCGITYTNSGYCYTPGDAASAAAAAHCAYLDAVAGDDYFCS